MLTRHVSKVSPFGSDHFMPGVKTMAVAAITILFGDDYPLVMTLSN